MWERGIRGTRKERPRREVRSSNNKKREREWKRRRSTTTCTRTHISSKAQRRRRSQVSATHSPSPTLYRCPCPCPSAQKYPPISSTSDIIHQRSPHLLASPTPQSASARPRKTSPSCAYHPPSAHFLPAPPAPFHPHPLHPKYQAPTPTPTPRPPARGARPIHGSCAGGAACALPLLLLGTPRAAAARPERDPDAERAVRLEGALDREDEWEEEGDGEVDAAVGDVSVIICGGSGGVAARCLSSFPSPSFSSASRTRPPFTSSILTAASLPTTTPAGAVAGRSSSAAGQRARAAPLAHAP